LKPQPTEVMARNISPAAEKRAGAVGGFFIDRDSPAGNQVALFARSRRS
jgi:hypothetical protein